MNRVVAIEENPIPIYIVPRNKSEAWPTGKSFLVNTVTARNRNIINHRAGIVSSGMLQFNRLHGNII
ncbi:hypothetical protein D3C77_590130 [compost metagenome]